MTAPIKPPIAATVPLIKSRRVISLSLIIAS